MSSPQSDAPQSNGMGSVVPGSGRKKLSALGSKVVQAYGHPIRAHALFILTVRTASPKQIAEEIGEPIGKVSYHVRELANSGMIELVETDGSRGGVQHFYRATRLAVVDLDAAEFQSNAERAASSSVVLNLMLADVAAAASGGSMDSRPERVLIRHHPLVDQEGWEQLSELYTEALFKAFAIHRESLERLEESGEEGIPAALHSLLFEMPEPDEPGTTSSLEWLDGAEASLSNGGRSEGRRVDDGDPSR